MAKKIFVAATGQNCGKTTTSLSLLHLARKSGRQVGFIKPFGPKPVIYQGRPVDVDAALMAHVYGMDAHLALMSPVVLEPRTTRRFLDGESSSPGYLERIDGAIAQLESRCDLLIIEGAGHSGVGSVMELNNAQLARRFQAPVLLVTGGGVGNVIDALHLNLALYREYRAEVRMILANKLYMDKRAETLHYLRLAFRDSSIRVCGGFNYSPILADPTLRYLAGLLEIPLRADPQQASRIVHHVQLAAAATQRVVDLLQESTLVIVTSTRDEVLVMLATLYDLPAYRDKLAGLIIAGIAPIADVVQRILNDASVPYMRCRKTTAEIYTMIREDVAKIGVEDLEKIALVQQLAEKEMDFPLIDELF